jgi:hypothetical protein
MGIFTIHNTRVIYFIAHGLYDENLEVQIGKRLSTKEPVSSVAVCQFELPTVRGDICRDEYTVW